MRDLDNLVFAHRGVYNNLNTVENSCKAFKKALDKNLNIELDVHITKDNELIVFHDYNLFRLTGKNKLVKNCTYDELCKLNLLDTKDKIPLLSEVLTLINGKVIIDIEIKNTNKKNLTLKLLDELLSIYNGKFIIQSFYTKYITIINSKYPLYKKGLLISVPEVLLDYIINSSFFIKFLKLDFIAYNKELAKSKKVQMLRKSIPIFIWTIKNEKEMNSFSKYADSFIMNFRY